MNRPLATLAFLLAVVPVLATGAVTPSAEMKSATVFVANYDDRGNFLGWGSGFYVDEGIVVTNKHVLEGADWHRVYATGADDKVNLQCYKAVLKDDVKINLNDDVAYMRAFLPCAHGTINFAHDARNGDAIAVLGFPYSGTGTLTLQQVTATGSVNGRTTDGWQLTSAYLDPGNSGGPVVNDTEVTGVAVAKGVDDEGNYVTGYFIPSSVIINGLLYVNDSSFSYTPRGSAFSSVSSRASSSSSSAFSSSSVRGSSSSASSRSSSSMSRSSASSRSSRRSSSAIPIFPDVSTTSPAYAAIQSLARSGVIGGYPDGTFRPANGINRAEFLKILVAGFSASELRNEMGCFRDVAREWFAQYVCAAKRLGWIDGYPDGTFRPSQMINRSEAMKILVTAFGDDVDPADRTPSDVGADAWFHPFVARGVTLRIVDVRSLFFPAENLTRADAALWIDGVAD